ncbi:hypothetical protein SDC9_186996 [bioreactor metagenome]|uniref:Uncharacterized protein n=1 Tax=bioreactor metagenome TaxID=1076179 RepID=A0A645HKC1_9ZZZZ
MPSNVCARCAPNGVSAPATSRCSFKKCAAPAGWYWKRIRFPLPMKASPFSRISLPSCSAATKWASSARTALARPPCCVCCWGNCSRNRAVLNWAPILRSPILTSYAANWMRTRRCWITWARAAIPSASTDARATSLAIWKTSFSLVTASMRPSVRFLAESATGFCWRVCSPAPPICW